MRKGNGSGGPVRICLIICDDGLSIDMSNVSAYIFVLSCINLSTQHYLLESEDRIITTLLPVAPDVFESSSAVVQHGQPVSDSAL